MEDLINLAELISRQKIKKIEIIGNANNKSKLTEFYEGIISGEFRNEKDAASALYNSEPANPNFKKLKFRLQDRLINTLLFIDVNKPHFKDTQRAYYFGQRALSAVNILFGMNVKGPGVRIAERAIKKAIQFEHTEIVLSLGMRLSRHYGTIIGDLKKYRYYRDITRSFSKIYEAEILANDYYNELAINNVKSGVFEEELKEKAIEYSNHLKTFLPEINSFQFLLFSYTVFWFRFIMKNDFKSALEICKEGVEQLKKKLDVPKNLLYLLYSRMLTCHIQLRSFEDGELVFKKALRYVDVGTYNWFILNKNYTLLSFRSKNYQKANEIYLDIEKHSELKKQPRGLQELWKINGAYIYFFNLIGLTDKRIEETKRKFKLNKFLNEVPMFSMDKKGVNIPILIIQLLFLLQRKEHGKFIDKCEALNAYSYRHLKKDDTFRSNCFIKMLLLLPKCNFHRIAVERKSKLLRAKLASVPLEIARQSAEIEIVPYEDLWEIVMDMLEAKFYKK
jgi:hypothetical protein